MEINKFLGLHLGTDTNIKTEELSKLVNARITEDLKIRKREGYKQLFNTITKKIQGMWQGTINGVYFYLFACNGHLYKLNADNTYTDIGTLTDAPTQMYFYNEKVYIINGHEYKSFDGTNLIDVSGYVPIIAIGTPPTGGGTPYEGINLLTGKKRQRFSADGTAKDYIIAESNVDSIDKVYVNGVLKTVTTDYTVNLVTGKVTFVTAPIVGQDNVEIWWTKGTGQRSEVTKYNQFSFYSGKNDSRVFLYGYLNKMIYSGLADGVPSMEYFPALNYSVIGSSENPIVYVTKQYDRQIIFTDKGAYYSNYEFDSTLGVNFTVYPLNDKIGSIVPGQVINNNPFTVTQSGVYEWSSTYVRDERNANLISGRVQEGLNEIDLSSALTYDYEEMGEFWLCIGKEVYIYNYRNDTWYYFELYDTPTCFMVKDGSLYMGTENGQIMKWAKYTSEDIPAYLTDNGNVITCEVETGFMDFGENYRRKFLNFAWVGMKPESKSKCFVEWETDYDVSTEPEVIYYSLLDFGNVDFADFSFMCNYNPQPFRLKLKAKKFTYFKLILTNNSENETMTILNITLPVIAGGVAK